MSLLPNYPLYVISKGRYDNCLTPTFLIEDGVPFYLVVEPQEADLYAARFGRERLKILPFSNLGLGSIPARNWVWQDSIENGHKRHWILDDNIYMIRHMYKRKRIRVKSGIAFHAIEDFTERYTNIGISGMNYTTFVGLGYDAGRIPPFYLNTHVYSCLLILNDMPYRWRGRYNEDTDLNLQVLTGGLCTVAFNSFMQSKAATMTMKGGNTDQLYKGDGRLEMARSLERQWPYAVKVSRRFQRPQHIVHDGWRKFDTQLIRRDDINWDEIANKKYDLNLVQVADEVKSPRIAALLTHIDNSLDEGIKVMEELIANPKDEVKYPIYIPSRKRSDSITTAKLFQAENLPFKIVIEPQDEADYRKHFADHELIVMDENDQGIAYARNFIKIHSRNNGDSFHWQFDDNIKNFAIRLNDKNTVVKTRTALNIIETVTDMYSNIGGSGIIHQAFAFAQTKSILVNRQIYTAMLLNNEPEAMFRKEPIEDTDYNMSILTAGYCTLLFCKILMNKATTMTMAGGNTEISHAGDGRLKRSLKLQEYWPNAFKIVEKKGEMRIAPSKVWASFTQRPKRKNEGDGTKK